MKVLVTDGDQRSALALTRSLGRRGIQVIVGAEKDRSLAASSKYCAGRLVYPSPSERPKDFYQSIKAFVNANNVDLIIPPTDVTIQVMAEHRSDLGQRVRVALPDLEAWRFVSNKSTLLHWAKDNDVPIPKTYFIDKVDDVKSIRHELRYPVVVKPALSVIPTKGRSILTKVHFAQSEDELIRLYEQKEYLRYPSVIQGRIVGPGIGIFVLFDRGELVTIFGHRRLREKPPAGGVSCLRESIAVDPDLREHAIKLFKPLKWHGVAMMEYKQDQKSGQPYLLEVNGRFWGSLQLAIDAGVDFPYLMYQLAMQEHVAAPSTYNIGVKSRWLLGDLDHMLLRIFRKDRDLYLPEGFPSRTRTLIQFLKFYEPGLYYEILSWSDPGPFAYELYEYLRRLFTRERIARA
jgi:predicted ATP-grasp superfamily ATP-dependent carboligase